MGGSARAVHFQASVSHRWASEMNVNGWESPCTGQKEIRRVSLRRIGSRQRVQTTMTGDGPIPLGAGVSSLASIRPLVVPDVPRAWIRGEQEVTGTRPRSFAA